MDTSLCREDIPNPQVNLNGLYEQKLPTEECGDAEACGLDVYFSENREDFQRLADGLAELPTPDPETKRRIVALRRLLRKGEGRNFKGKYCWNCGDALICHEAPADAIVVSKNRRHFEPLCELTGKALQHYS